MIFVDLLSNGRFITTFALLFGLGFYIQFERAQGVVFSGNTLCVGRDDGAGGEWSPDYAMVFGSLDGCMITNNVMHNGASKELIIDRGNHTNTVVKDNVGSIGTLPW